MTGGSIDTLVQGGGAGGQHFDLGVGDGAEFAGEVAHFGGAKIHRLEQVPPGNHGFGDEAEGVVDVAARVDAMSAARIERMFAINVFGTMWCAREAVRRMSTRHGGPGGAIVNLSSAAAKLGAPGQYVDYAAAKGAVDAFTLGLAREVATEGIRVNAVRPGIIETDIHASGGQPGRAAQMAPMVPMQRAGSAMEVAQAIVWLLSADSGYTTGSVVDVTGGR